MFPRVLPLEFLSFDSSLLLSFVDAKERRVYNYQHVVGGISNGIPVDISLDSGDAWLNRKWTNGRMMQVYINDARPRRAQSS